MSLLQHDGFDHYGTTALQTPTSVAAVHLTSRGYEQPTGTCACNTAYGKNTGSLGVGLTAITTTTGNLVWLKRAIKPEAAFATGAAYTPTVRVVKGFAARFAVAPTGNLQFARIAGVNVSIGSDWYIYVDGVNTNYQCELNIWNFVELVVDIAANKFQLWMSEVMVLEKAITGYTLDFWEIRAQYTSGGTSHIPIHVDDSYLLDGVGTYNNQRIGKCTTLTRFPTADFSVQMAPLSGTTNFPQVNQAVPDGDSTYVQSATAGATDLYTNVTAIPTIDDAAIRAVSIVPAARMLEPDSLSVTAVINVEGTEAVGYRMKLRAGYFSSQAHIFEVSPKTNLPWTPTEAQNVRFGQRILAKP